MLQIRTIDHLSQNFVKYKKCGYRYTRQFAWKPCRRSQRRGICFHRAPLNNFLYKSLKSKFELNSLNSFYNRHRNLSNHSNHYSNFYKKAGEVVSFHYYWFCYEKIFYGDIEKIDRHKQDKLTSPTLACLWMAAIFFSISAHLLFGAYTREQAEHFCPLYSHAERAVPK